MRRVLGFVIVTTLALPSVAHAAELAWRAPPDCARASMVTEQVERLVGQRLATIEGIDFAIDVELRPDGRYRLVLQTLALGSAPRSREIEGASCDEVADAASVAIALALSERTRTEPSASSEAPSVLDDMGAQSATGSGNDSQDADRAGTEPAVEPAVLRSGFSAALLFESGALPEVGFGVELGASLEYGLLKATAAFSTFASQEARLPDDDRGGSFDLLFGALQACVHPSIDKWHGLGCAGFELGAILAQGKGINDARSGSSVWAAPRAELGAGYAFSDSARLWLRGGLAFALYRPEFLLEDTFEVHKPANWSTRGLLAFELVL